jgi:hypothetical protein
VVVPNGDTAAQGGDEAQSEHAADLETEGETAPTEQPVEPPAEEGVPVEATATSTLVVQAPAATAAPTPPPATIPTSGGILSTASDVLPWAAGGFLLILLAYSAFNHFNASARTTQE